MLTDSRRRVASFYDEFVGKQERVGLNPRHHSILRHLKRFGLRRTDRVLEIGCGIGTVTGLITDYVRQGYVLGIDISPRSIEAARQRLAHVDHVAFVVSDMSDFEAREPFDVVVLPDVLEHIPVEQHAALFETIRRSLRPGGFVLIHIPNPRFLEWLIEHRPEALQVIDQPLHTDALLRDAYGAGFYLHHLETYRLFHEQPDYQLLVLRPQRPMERVEVTPKVRQFVRDVLGRLGLRSAYRGYRDSA